MISKIKKPVSILLSLIMVFSLFTIVPMTAQAASHNITINNAQNGSVTASVNGSTVTSAEEGSTVTLTAMPNNGYRLKSISGTYKRNPYEAKPLNGTKNLTGTYFSYTATDAAGAGWKLANNSSIKITSTSKTITKLEFNMSQRGNSFNVNNVSCTAGTKSLSGNTFVVSSVNTQSITLSSSANNAGYVRFNSVKVYYNGDAVDETLSISGTGNVRTFIMPVVAEGAVTITPEFEESPKYSVTLTGGANATASGNTEQTGIVEGNSMDTVTYTANSGYYFAEFTNITNNGITAMRINETTVTVSGTPTANASITIPDAVFAHTHDFTYSASGATITATCNGAGDCDITEGLTMTISAPTGDLTADGSKTFPATLNDDYNTTAFPGTYTIAYTKDGQPYDGTPTEAGDYTASVTVGTATASVSYTVAAPELFPQHSITLGGNIGVNFFINSKTADFASDENAYVKFTWDNGTYNKEVKLKDLTTDAKGYYKASVDVVAAQMAHKIHAEVYLNGEKLDQTDDYSVQDYAETVFKDPAAYDDKGKPEQLKALVAALLNYGAQAQIVFDSALTEKPDPADTVKVVGQTDFSTVTVEKIQSAINAANPGKSASDLTEVATQLGAEFYTSSLIYLSRNTLRLYFTPASKTVGALNGLDFSGNLSEYYYFKDVENIPAAELDNLQEFKVGSTTFYFSALDYAKAVVNSGMGDDQKNLAKSLYLYNMTANDYFDAAPAPVENVVDLGTLEGAKELQNGDVVTGELKGDYQITIADGATVTLRGVDITCLSDDAEYAGITPLGDATIMLEGTNTVKGGYDDFPGILVPENTTLTIDGTGSLNASSNGYGCGIGGGYKIAAGNIVINGGTIIVTGGDYAAGIGSGGYASCGTITINGGTITANGGVDAAGIGSGYEEGATCGNILITGGTVTANGGANAAGIGSAVFSSSCGDITITGGTVTATGGESAAGIGSGLYSNCGDITIAGTVTQVTATKGEDAPNSIGAGDEASCGTVTIGGKVTGSITNSPYTYQP